MRKKEAGSEDFQRERVLARLLAEDLRRVSGAGGYTPVVTEPDPRPDITNGPSDNDGVD
jgi:hypothetical protein